MTRAAGALVYVVLAVEAGEAGRAVTHGGGRLGDVATGASIPAPLGRRHVGAVVDGDLAIESGIPVAALALVPVEVVDAGRPVLARVALALVNLLAGIPNFYMKRKKNP